MRGPGAAFVVVALQLVVGTFVWMWISMMAWKAIGRGHYRALMWTLFPAMLALAFALPPVLRLHAFVEAGLLGAFLAAVYSQVPLLEQAGGALTSASGLGLAARTGLLACAGDCRLLGPAQALAGSLFVGAVTHGMVLGHWYLNQPRLPIEPLRAATGILFGSMLPPLALGLWARGLLLEGAAPGGVLAVSADGYWWAWLVLLAATALLGLMIRSTVRSRSTQSATGLLYVAMIPALGAQFLLGLLAAT